MHYSKEFNKNIIKLRWPFDLSKTAKEIQELYM